MNILTVGHLALPAVTPDTKGSFGQLRQKPTLGSYMVHRRNALAAQMPGELPPKPNRKTSEPSHSQPARLRSVTPMCSDARQGNATRTAFARENFEPASMNPFGRDVSMPSTEAVQSVLAGAAHLIVDAMKRGSRNDVAGRERGRPATLLGREIDSDCDLVVQYARLIANWSRLEPAVQKELGDVADLSLAQAVKNLQNIIDTWYAVRHRHPEDTVPLKMTDGREKTWREYHWQTEIDAMTAVRSIFNQRDYRRRMELSAFQSDHHAR